MKKRNKAIALMMSLMLIVGAVVGGTVAYLITNTDPLVNTFTAGDINITLTESKNLDLKMVPGKVIAKDPKVTVLKDSEACWLFVKIEKTNNVDTFLTYAVADGWTALTDVNGVYYREVAATTADTSFSVLANDQVTVLTTVTKNQLTALTDSTYPKLSFTAYAIQKEGFATASAAWTEINK